jgi:hypothetical protein
MRAYCLQVSNAAKPTPLTAVLTGPSFLGPCDRLFLSALETRGVGSGAMKYTWMVFVVGTLDVTRVQDILAAHEGPTLELEPGMLPPGHRFLFSVRVTSIWGLRGTASLTVETEVTPETPAVTVYGPTVDFIDSSEPYFLEGSAQSPSRSCIEGSAAEVQTDDLRFMWTVKPEIFFHPTMQQVTQAAPCAHRPSHDISWHSEAERRLLPSEIPRKSSKDPPF